MAATANGRLVREIRRLVGEAEADAVPDGHLLERFARLRDEAAFEALVRRYGRLVLGVCRRVLRDPHAADDAFQATFLVLVHKAGSLDRRRPIADWLYTVAFRLACRARLNAERRRRLESAADVTLTAVLPPTADDTAAVLHEELNRLPERHRAPLVLAYLEGRTYEQVSQAIGCPVGSVGWRLSQAIRMLHDRLADRGIVAPAIGVTGLLTAAASGAPAAPLIEATVRAGLWFAGETVIGVAASTAAVQLARGTLGAMTTHKLMLAAGVLLSVGLCGGTAWLARTSAMPDPPMAAVKVAAPAKANELPEGAVARMGSSQFRHGEAVFFIAYTADGKHVVTAGRDHAIKLWDRASGKAIRSFERGGAKVATAPKPAMAMPGKMMSRPASSGDFPIALSPDGKTLAAGRDATLTVWNVATGKTIHELTAPAIVFELMFTPDSQSLVAADTADTITVWDPAAGKVRKTTKLPTDDLDGRLATGTAVSPTGTHAAQQFIEATGGNGALKIIDLATGKAGDDIKLSVGGTQCITFSPDGKLLAWASFTDGLIVWDILAGKKRTSFSREGVKRQFFGGSIRFSDDGTTLAVTLANDAIELWDVATGKLVRTIAGHETAKTNRVAVAIVLGAGVGRMTRSDLAFSADGKTVAASQGSATVRQFDTGTGTEVSPTAGHRSGVIAVGSDGRTVVSVSKESVRVWDAAGKERRQWPLAPPAIAAVVSADGKRVVTSAGGGVVRLWDTTTGEKVRDIETKRADAAGLGFSPDGTILATKAELNSAINLWDTATGAHLRTVGQDGESMLSGGRFTIGGEGAQTPMIAFSPDGRLLAAVGDKKQVCVWDVASGAAVCELTAASAHAVLTGGEVATLPPSAVAFTFSANGQVVALLMSDGSVVGYEVATGEKRYQFQSTAGGVDPLHAGMTGGAMTLTAFSRGNAAGGGVGFTADGRFVVAGAAGPALRVWDTLTGQEVAQLNGHQGSVSVLRPAADGRSFVSGSVDTTAVAWTLDHLPRVELTRAMPLTDAEVELLWTDLAKPDPATAFVAGRKLLTDRGRAVALFKDRLHPVPAVESARVERLVADLGGSFDARRKATTELDRLGEQAIPQLRAARDKYPPLDHKQRIEKLLEKATVRKLHGDGLRELRAVELLELAASADAKAVLAALAKGEPSARLSREAGAAGARVK